MRLKIIIDTYDDPDDPNCDLSDELGLSEPGFLRLTDALTDFGSIDTIERAE